MGKTVDQNARDERLEPLIRKYLELDDPLKKYEQIVGPVKWNFKAIKVDTDTYEIHYTATMESPWHIYSQSSDKTGSSPISYKH